MFMWIGSDLNHNMITQQCQHRNYIVHAVFMQLIQSVSYYGNNIIYFESNITENFAALLMQTDESMSLHIFVCKYDHGDTTGGRLSYKFIQKCISFQKRN
jgi:hypothetical protein